MSRPTKKSKRTGSVTVRITPEQRARIDRAAEAQGKSALPAMSKTVSVAAEVVPLDQALAGIDAPTYARFVEMLEGAPQLNDRLRKLMQGKAPRK